MTIPKSPENPTPTISPSKLDANQHDQTKLIQELTRSLVDAIKLLVPDAEPTESEFQTNINPQGGITVSCQFAGKRVLEATYKNGLISCLGVSHTYSPQN
jgi:hypothetical protein